MGSLTALPQVPQSFQIIVPVGTVLWLVAYISIFVWSFKHTRLGTWVGIGMSAFLILLGIIDFFQKFLLTQPWTIIALGVALLIITLLQSNIGRNFPLI